MKILLFICLSALVSRVALAQDIGALWKAVEDAAAKDQPKTAIEALSKIYGAAIASEAWDDALAAAGQRAILEGKIEEGMNAYGVTLKLDEVRKTAPDKLKPLLDALSAEWLSRYFSENIWRFRQRSAIAEADEGNDIDSWSLPRIQKEVDARLAVVLDNPAVFTQYPTSQFKRSFEQGNVSDTYRPTLYDVLAWRAVDYYNKINASRFDDSDFKPTLEMPLFADADTFIAWASALPKDSPGAKVLRLTANVMHMHKEKSNTLAFADADFNRLITVRHLLQMAHTDEARLSSAYDKALDTFVTAHKNNEVSARGMAVQAKRLCEAKQYVEALALAEKGMDAFPKSLGAQECYNVILDVKKPSLEIETETVWARSKPEARPNGQVFVTCRNIPKLYFRLYPTTITAQNASATLHVEIKNILKKEHTHSWEMPIQADDYQEVERTFDVQEQLTFGVYVLAASTRDDFLYDEKQNTISARLVQVSDLAAEILAVNNIYHIRVVNNETGLPIENVGVTHSVYNYQTHATAVTHAVTDDEGNCQSATVQSGRSTFEFKKGDDSFIYEDARAYSHFREQGEDSSYVLLLTDRSIYRPGQTVRYKGIYYTANPKTGEYAIRPDAEWTLQFHDPNDKVIDSRKERANRFGSFSGSFVIPADRGTGRMTLQMSDKHRSSVGFRVEEYKRPKFEVVFDQLKEEVKLNDNVTLSGRAATYSGLPLEQATVKWTVMRNAYYPSWVYYYRQPWQGSPTLATGEAKTDADGTFKVSFVAEPEPNAKPEDSPCFNYTIRAEVIDTTGETRAGSQAIRLGFSAVNVSLDVPEWFTADTPNDVTIRLTTLNGEPVAATGKAVVYTLQQPERPSRGKQSSRWYYGRNDKTGIVSPMEWDVKKAIENVPFMADATGIVKLPFRLPVGCYRIEATALDKQGNPVTDKAIITVIDPASKTYPVKVPFAFTLQQGQCKVGETFRAVWGSGYTQACGVLEIWADNKLIKRVTSQPGETQTLIEFDVPESLRGGFTVRSSMIREGRLWTDSHMIRVPWDNKELKLNWTHINSKLEPGKQEKWTLTVKDNDAKAAHAEVVAAMYDTSLDAFGRHYWSLFNGFRNERTYFKPDFISRIEGMIFITRWYPPYSRGVVYPIWSDTLLNQWVFERVAMRGSFGTRMGGAVAKSAMVAAAAPMVPATADAQREMAVMNIAGGDTPATGARFREKLAMPGAPAEAPPVIRKNLEETAFFIPDLETDEEGNVSISFTAPEALTGWRVMAFAHDAALRSGSAEARAVTQRKLMVIPNLPRFLREGDSIGIPVKVVNTGDAPQKGVATLSLVDGRTGKPVEGLVGGLAGQPFDLPPGASCVVSWTLAVPDALAGLLQYTILAKAAEHGDGEEGFLPVLSRRVQVTESMPFSVRGGQEKTLDFKRLLASADDKTLRHLSLQAEMTPNTTWNAILALPYLMEYPHECAEQVFHRYYANALARQVVSDNPAIAEVFSRWKAAGGKALESPLTKNPHLKALAVEETPWLLASDKETEQRRNIAVLFDAGRLAREQEAALRKLKGMRAGGGLWPWFSGGRENGYISMLIMAGFGRLQHIGVKTLDNDLLNESIVNVDTWRMREDAAYAERNNGQPRPLSAEDALYLYGRSFFLKSAPLSDAVRAYVNTRLALAKTDWTDLSRLSRAQLAIAFKRLGDPGTAADILRSIRENALTTEEQGMCWRDASRSWWWHELPLESQAMMIEAFLEVGGDQASADACALWLLHQKQAQRWPTTVATAQAVYALLLAKNTSLAPYAEATLTLGGAEVKPEAAEAGTGYFAKRYAAADVRPELGRVKVANPGNALALGALHWQYLQDLDKLTPSADGTPLRIKRQLFKLGKAGGKRTLHPLDDTVRQGDTVVTRIEVRVDRDMDFVHLKDTRAASLEPDDVLSSYRWQNAVGYFQSTRDTATHFFFDRLPRGTYVFEYDSHVFQSGTCNGGFAEIQCMYAPEFNAHSASEVVRSK